MRMEYSKQILDSSELYTIFGRNVQTCRKLRGQTQEALAAALECDQKYVSRIENGQAKPNLPVCLKIANYLHVSLEELLQGVCEVSCSPKEKKRLCNRQMLDEIGRVIANYMD